MYVTADFKRCIISLGHWISGNAAMTEWDFKDAYQNREIFQTFIPGAASHKN